MGYISVRNVHKEFMKDGEPLTILENINLDIERGEFICLLGPSGSGKSTLLNAMAARYFGLRYHRRRGGESTSTAVCNGLSKLRTVAVANGGKQY